MCSIPTEVLLMILEHVGKADLATLCRVSKFFCSCSQDFLYRQIHTDNSLVIRTLAQSTDLARRVRSFDCPRLTSTPELPTALKNMLSLRTLDLRRSHVSSILDGCTFKLDTFRSGSAYDESL